MKTINPATEELVREYPEDTLEQINAKINTLHRSFDKWSKMSISDRGKVMLNVADILEQDKEKFAQLLTNEMGKVFKQGIAEIEKCALVCRYFSANSEEFLQTVPIKSDAQNSYVEFTPLGVILGVMPWNFPFWQVFRFAVPTLMAGNTILLKHASNVTGSSLAITEIFDQAMPNLEILASVIVPGAKVADLIANPYIQGVSLTGSTAAGKSVASAAGAHIKKCVLELGGSDPFIVLSDADLEHAAEAGTTSRMISTGQNCIAAKRFIVMEDVYDVFLNKLIINFKALQIGDPTKIDTDIGPLANKQMFDTLTEQVASSIQQGARCVLGGDQVPGKGYFYQPTILTDIPNNCKAATEELFGPVASIFKVKTEQEAIQLANNTSYGLGAVIFTRNTAKAALLAKDAIQAGSVFINDFTRSDPRLPFGGIKESGYGRELSGYGIREFVNCKVIYIA